MHAEKDSKSCNTIFPPPLFECQTHTHKHTLTHAHTNKHKETHHVAMHKCITKSIWMIELTNIRNL